MESKISRLKSLLKNLSDEDAKRLLNVINENYKLVNNDFNKITIKKCIKEKGKEYEFF